METVLVHVFRPSISMTALKSLQHDLDYLPWARPLLMYQLRPHPLSEKGALAFPREDEIAFYGSYPRRGG